MRGNVLTSNGTTWQSTALPNNSIGVGQTWQNVTSSRTKGTTYTNSTGKPIMVMAIGAYESAGNQTLSITVDGVAMSVGFATGYGGTPMSVIVPNGSSYVVTYGANLTWFELR